MAVAYLSYKTFLMKGVAGTGSTVTWSKIVDILDMPALGGDPEQVDVTTLSNKNRVFIEGIQSGDSWKFNANYTPEAYQAIKALADGKFAVWLGGTEESDGTLTPTGSLGKFSVEGSIDVYIDGAGVNEQHKMVITVTPSTDVTEEFPVG